MRNLAILFLILALLAGCSGGPTGGAPTTTESKAAVNPLRKLIKNAALTLRVEAIVHMAPHSSLGMSRGPRGSL